MLVRHLNVSVVLLKAPSLHRLVKFENVWIFGRVALELILDTMLHVHLRRYLLRFLLWLYIGRHGLGQVGNHLFDFRLLVVWGGGFARSLRLLVF